jgi:hypothetical protein
MRMLPTMAGVMARQRRAQEAGHKPRRAVTKARGRVGYAIGAQRLRGLHRFLRHMLFPVEQLTEKGLKWFDEKRPDSLKPVFTVHNSAADDRKRGPMRTSFDAGIRLDRMVRSAIRERKMPRKKQKKDYTSTWAGTVLMLVTDYFRVTPTRTQLLCASKAGQVATEIDFIGKDKEGGLVFFELKSTAGGTAYATDRKYAWSPYFVGHCKRAGIKLPRILLSQCDRDLLQVLCGRILYDEHANTWKTRDHKREASVSDMLVVRSPQPNVAEAYRVPSWMANLAQQILSFMCATAQ